MEERKSNMIMDDMIKSEKHARFMSMAIIVYLASSCDGNNFGITAVYSPVTTQV